MKTHMLRFNKAPLLALLAFAVVTSTSIAQTAAPTASLSVTPTTVAGSGTPKLTWSSTNATGCTGSGGTFTGNKATSGSEILAPVATAGAIEYSITCTGTTPAGSLVLTWTPPTQNTDGSALTDLASFKILYGVGTATDKTITLTNVGLRSYTLGNLTPQTSYSIKMRAVNAAGVESADSATVTGTPQAQAAQTATAKATFTVTSMPNPPIELKVTQTTVYRLDQALDAIRLVAVGTVPLDTKCDEKITMMGLYRVDRALVVPKPGFLRPNVALAKCG